jgi:hypothetical protein
MPAIVNTSQKHETKALTSSQQATAQIPAGGKILSLIAHFMTSAGASVTEAQIRSEIANIRLAIGGKDIVNTTPTIILDTYEMLQNRVGVPAAVAGTVELNLARLAFLDPAVRDGLGFGTFDQNSIQLQVTAGTLSAIASFEVHTTRIPSTENLGAYGTLLNFPRSFNSTGQDSMDTIPKNQSTTVVAFLVQTGASGVIVDSEVRISNAQFGTQTLRERVPLNVNKQELSNDGYAQPSGYFIHMMTDSNLAKRLPLAGATDLRVTTNFSTAPGAGGYGVAVLAIENLPANL